MATGGYRDWSAEILSGLEKLNLKIEDVLSTEDPLACKVCDVSLNPHHSGPGQNLGICSERCILNFWADVSQTHLSRSGELICLLPGCTKKCYVYEDGYPLDYCDVSIKRCQLPGCRRLCYMDNSGQAYDHCGRKHSKMHKQTTPFCSLCLQEKSPVLFYNSSDPYYELSNFYEFAPFVLDGKKWKSSEHYFQAQKFIGSPHEELIRTGAVSPRNAFEMARCPSVIEWQRADWEKVKLSVMYKALLAKFLAHPRLKLLLYSTGNRKLVEHSYNDSFWGDGSTGNGQNYLGRLLEDVRLVLCRKEPKVLK